MNWFTKFFQNNKQQKAEATERQMHIEKLTREKEEATAKQESWVGVISMEVDPENISAGSFELDWNEFFIAKLIRAGYEGKTDADLVDQWFSNVCRNIVLETYEQDAADRHPVKSRKLDGGRREYN